MDISRSEGIGHIHHTKATPFRYIALIAVAICISCSSDQSAKKDFEQSVVNDFKSLVKEAEKKTNAPQETNFHKLANKWARRKFEVREISIDVKKTDSLTTPYTATVAFTLYVAQTPLSATRAEAERNPDPDLSTSKHSPSEVILQYQFNDKWVFSRGQRKLEHTYADVTKIYTYDFDRKKLEKEPNGFPNAAILYWLPSK
jgi:hypothetical protein